MSTSPEPPDQAARDYAIDPRHNVVLEASAGTGKTSVLVRRYLALLDAEVDPANILAITFTRKAAAEMRERIIAELRRRAAQSADGQRRWRRLRDRLGDVTISTIDAFCLALLGEFPLEADLDPGFTVADETEVAVLLEATLDRALRVVRAGAREHEGLRLLLAQVPQRRLVRALAHLIDRRVVASDTLARVLARGPRDPSIDRAVRLAADRVAGALRSAPGGLLAIVNDRPAGTSRFDLLQADIEALVRGAGTAAELRAALAHVGEHFVAQDGRPRHRVHGVRKSEFPTGAAWDRHNRALRQIAPEIAEVMAVLERDTNAILVEGLVRLHATAVDIYRRILDEHDVVDFAESLARTVSLLANMDEFAQSRYRLQSRYHHVLVDEFQDTSRLQWRLVSLLVEAWGEGYGLVDEAPVPPTIFVVGDRKQSIYRFRDADVTILNEATSFIAALRPGDRPRRSISHSFRARPELLAFVNDLCEIAASGSRRHDAFRYGPEDRFPLDAATLPSALAPSEEPALGAIATASEDEAARIIAAEIARLLQGAQVRDLQTGLPRDARAGDVAVLFRVRESHRAYEQALAGLRVPTYVYKGLGFFESDEILDLTALIRFLARPGSEVRVAALLRSRLVRLSDPALLALSGDLGSAVLDARPPAAFDRLEAADRMVLEVLRAAVPGWLSRVDRVPPAELVDDILRQTAYDYELRGPRAVQAHENVKKLRMLIRRLQNRGYLTMARLAEHLGRLSAGDESNAMIDAVDAVNLMTVHAAKGLEFPIVFLVDLGRGVGGGEAIRVIADDGRGKAAVTVAGFRSDAEAAQREADREEARRLLYVALTRARDRLYVAGRVRHGRLQSGRGSLAEVVPREFVGFLVELASRADATPVAHWMTPAGREHRFRRLVPPARPSPSST